MKGKMNGLSLQPSTWAVHVAATRWRALSPFAASRLMGRGIAGVLYQNANLRGVKIVLDWRGVLGFRRLIQNLETICDARRSSTGAVGNVSVMEIVVHLGAGGLGWCLSGEPFPRKRGSIRLEQRKSGGIRIATDIAGLVRDDFAELLGAAWF